MGRKRTLANGRTSERLQRSEGLCRRDVEDRAACALKRDRTDGASSLRAAHYGNDQALTVTLTTGLGVPARSAKSAASLACQALACSVTARWAFIRSSTARRR